MFFGQITARSFVTAVGGAAENSTNIAAVGGLRYRIVCEFDLSITFLLATVSIVEGFTGYAFLQIIEKN